MLNQAGVPLYEIQTTEVEETAPSYSPEKTERILALLTEYTEKLKTGYDELQMQRRRVRVLSFVVLTVVAILGFAGIVLNINAGVSNYTWWKSPLITVTGAGFAMYLFVQYIRFESKFEQEQRDRLKALARRLEPLTRWAVQIHEHAERDEIRRLELNLRLTEAKSYIEQVE